MNNQTLSRATTIEELEIVTDKFFDEASRERGLAFQPNPDDIIISPYAKSGTTWLQHIAHGLRTKGNLNFDEISDVTPWIEVAYDMGIDLDAQQVAEPRVFKSHLSWHDIPKGARYIVSIRHPYDATVSYYRFYEGWMFEPGTISLEEIIGWRYRRDKIDSSGYWYHLASWWEQRENPDVLLLCYEDMKKDLPGTVRKVARFMDVPLDDDLLDIVVRQSTREFMLTRTDQFNDHNFREIGGKRADLPPAISSDKVTPGTSKAGRYTLTPAQKDYLDSIWQEQITSRFGLKNFEELCKALAEIDQSAKMP